MMHLDGSGYPRTVADMPGRLRIRVSRETFRLTGKGIVQSDENCYKSVNFHFEVLTLYIFHGIMPVGHLILSVLQGVIMFK